MNPWLMRGIKLAYPYACWPGMMAVHECGHALHAWLSGGEVTRVVLPLIGFSRTDLSRSPHPLVVAWGGALWGSLIPLALLAIAAASRFRWTRWVQFFAGFCLIANGGYLAVGSFIRAGDAGDLMQNGAPQWTLVVAGALGAAAGLFLWHLLGLEPHARRDAASRARGIEGRAECQADRTNE